MRQRMGVRSFQENPEFCFPFLIYLRQANKAIVEITASFFNTLLKTLFAADGVEYAHPVANHYKSWQAGGTSCIWLRISWKNNIITNIIEQIIKGVTMHPYFTFKNYIISININIILPQLCNISRFIFTTFFSLISVALFSDFASVLETNDEMGQCIQEWAK